MARAPVAPDWVEKGHRRSMRVLLNVAVTVEGKTGKSGTFQEETHTLVVNAHGALLVMAGSVETGQVIRLTNRLTKQGLDCRVVYLGPTHGGKMQVGLEFCSPCADFWQITFPSEDWRSN